jgi:hypothetical protein
MSFLRHWKKQEHEEIQTTLFGADQPLVQSDEPGRISSNKSLQREISKRGGNPATHADVNLVVAENVLGQSVKEVCKGLGVRDRSQLPTPAKEALMMGDVAARNQIQMDDAQGHEELVKSADEGSSKLRPVLPWFQKR